MDTTDIEKNIILYGPPGTGKTYNTAIYAVAIIKGISIEEAKKMEYKEVLKLYNDYKNDGLIEFITFHQSYSYEEFIEGIKPDLEDGQENIKYKYENGIFKEFCNNCEERNKNRTESIKLIRQDPEIWQVKLGGPGDNETRRECMEKEHIRVDYGVSSKDEDVEAEGFKQFKYDMKIGDIVLSGYNNKICDAIGVVTKNYDFSDKYKEYPSFREVKWLVKRKFDVKEFKQVGFSNSAVHIPQKINKEKIMNMIKEYKENHVFIIDEINRGNISKIFGELITLIEDEKRIDQSEDKKRIGQSEEMRIKLPYSRKPFGVPDNVYIIGTMNTADRSITAIDTALRRRFSFIEMMPDIKVLEGVSVDGIKIDKMLENMNKKIEVLFDKEHTIGQAYFIKLLKNNDIKVLANIFIKDIIPLLQEYFYEDNEKVRLVLGDNKKKGAEEFEFIKEISNKPNELFGENIEDIEETKTYKINTDAFFKKESYLYI